MAAVNWPSSKTQKIDLPVCFNNTLGYVDISRMSFWEGRFASCVRRGESPETTEI